MGATTQERKGGLATLMFFLGLALLLGWSTSAEAAECLLLASSKAEGAELKVYFTKFAQEDTTKGAYKACRIVKKAEPGAKTFFITPFRQDANVVVHRDNWPSGS